jgi:hypothetical protein
VRLTVADDTVIVPPHERFLVSARAGRGARVSLTVTPAVGPGDVVWRADAVVADAPAEFGWDLRTPGGEPLASGRYVLRVVADDATGARALASETVTIARLLPVPRPLTAAQLEPETLIVSRTEPWAIGIGTAAAVLPSLLGRRELRIVRAGDAGNWIVAGGVTVLGFVAFLAGRHPEFSRENARLNAEARARQSERIREVEAANALARERTGYRIWREGGAP